MVTDEDIDNYLHESVHLQMETNEHYLQQFGIGSFERWDYDMDKETLTFSHEGVPHVVAAIQVAGSISNKSNIGSGGGLTSIFLKMLRRLFQLSANLERNMKS